MKDRILQTLRDLRAYALQKGVAAAFLYHEEDSYLIRFANSAISLNTNEHLIRLEITAYDGSRRASYELITNLDEMEEMKRGVDMAAEMVKHAQPLTYQPTLPLLPATFADESGYDEALATLSSEERVLYFNKASEGLETDEIRLSGIFYSGANILAQINTRSEHTQYFKTSDAQVTAVLAHSRLKWEVIAEQSAQSKAGLKPEALHADLTLMLDHYLHDTPVQLPVGKYDVVFGPAATAEFVSFMNYIGFNGGNMKRGYSFLADKDVCQKVFSEQVTLVDDPSQAETFPFQRDLAGMERKPYPIFENGIFQGFLWDLDDADEFGAQPTGHTVPHTSLTLRGGASPVNSLQALIAMPRERDVLYIPFMHYTNIVNPSKGLFTGSSRFGALLLKADGTVAVPYNVRLTQSLQDVFGDKVAWLSSEVEPYNVSSSYGARNPTSIIVPRFMQVNDLEISHSNSSY